MARKNGSSKKSSNKRHNPAHEGKIRYAVVGLGYISQAAILPAFTHASRNSSLEALVSGDSKKLESLGKKYGVSKLYTYRELDQCFQSGDIDAVYIALPNSMHRDCTLRAAAAGVHVLCEKPMAVRSKECEEMIRACRENQVKLMIAYRLQLEPATIEVRNLVRQGAIGEPVIFNSSFSMQVTEGGIRTRRDLGGGALYDIGIYCINAARMLFDGEPRWVQGLVSNPRDQRFREVDGVTSGVLEFGRGKIASFVASFASADCARYEIVGEKGSIQVKNAFEFESPISYEITVNEKTRKKTIRTHDQFAPELMHFSDAILTNSEIIPSGEEGLADVRIIEALYRSSEEGRIIELGPLADTDHKKESSMHFQIESPPPVKRPVLLHAKQPFQ